MASTASGRVFDLAIIEMRPGFAVLQVTGKGARAAFSQEAGGHRWQRIPPTEKRGRIHTSTITVAVLPMATTAQVVLNDNDLEFKTCRGSGAGGQHRNVTDSAVQLTHLPTGLSVRCEGERSQKLNKDTALDLLRSRLLALEQARGSSTRNESRRDQVGTGMRGDKARTIAIQRDQVQDHRRGTSMTAKAYLRGQLEELTGQ